MIYLVCGLGRCGTTMVMKMLHKGGLEVCCADTACYEFETPEEGILAIENGDADGKAIKLLDIQNYTIPEGKEYKMIWLTRNYTEQAKSQVKFLTQMIGIKLDVPKREAERRTEKSLIKDTTISLRKIHRRQFSYLMLTFEDILKEPKGSATKMKEFFQLDLDIEQMAKAVLRRQPKCAPDMKIEKGFIFWYEQEQKANKS